MGYAIIIHLLLIIVGLFFGYFDYKKRNDNKLSIFMGANLVFIFIYGIIPIILMLNNFFIGKTDFYLIYTININNEPYFFSSIIIFIGYISFFIGYLVGWPYKPARVKLIVPPKRLKVIGIMLLVISSISSLYIAYQLGGFITSLKFITKLRSGEVIVPSSIFLLLPLSITSFAIFYSTRFNNTKQSLFNSLFLIISLFLAIYYVLIFGGRLPVALFILILPMYYMEKQSKFSLKNIFIIAVIGIIFLNYLEAFFHFISQSSYSTKGVFDNIPRIIAQFSFPYINTLKVHEFTFSRGEFRYFIDFVSWIINYIPKSFSSKIGLDQIPASYIVNSNNHLTTGIPTDLISFGYYQFALPGVIIITALFGRIISWFDRTLRSSDSESFIQLAKVRLFQILVFFPMYADIEAFMRRRLDTVIIILILVFFSRKSYKKPNCLDKNIL